MEDVLGYFTDTSKTLILFAGLPFIIVAAKVPNFVSTSITFIDRLMHTIIQNLEVKV